MTDYKSAFSENLKSKLEEYRPVFYNALNGELAIFKTNLEELLSMVSTYKNEFFLDENIFDVATYVPFFTAYVCHYCHRAPWCYNERERSKGYAFKIDREQVD